MYTSFISKRTPSINLSIFILEILYFSRGPLAPAYSQQHRQEDEKSSIVANLLLASGKCFFFDPPSCFSYGLKTCLQHLFVECCARALSTIGLGTTLF